MPYRSARASRLQNAVMLGAVAIVGFATPLAAQTDYYNTSTGRPMRIEDASPLEYRGVELDLTPLRWERAPNASYRWSLHPEVAVGILPRTQLQIGVPFAFIDQRAASTRGAAGLEISALHALNAETSIPALAIAGDVLLPVGSLSADASYGTLKAIATRTTRLVRVHANAQVTIGPGTTDAADAPRAAEVSRWMAGIAVDRTLPLRSLLLSAESFAEQPTRDGAKLEWNAGVGARLQLAPRWAVDAGAGRRLTGDERTWYATFGTAYALGIP
ncbi:MAG TPA: hypothetical protein VM076_17610 [Gemmatimonadaceae bacterium]|nr:hypothetical protein [Gemmatimonadaceae bacterium]